MPDELAELCTFWLDASATVAK